MDELFTQVLSRIENKFHLEPVSLPQELAETKFILNVLDLHCFNWKAQQLRKVYCMRLKVKMPSLDVIGMAFYPEPCYDVPIFVFDLSCTSKKVVSYINFIAVSNNEDYHKKYIDPLKPLYEKYGHFPYQKMREWMQVYRNPCTIYSMPDRSCLDELKTCVHEYLGVYLELLSGAEKINDPDYCRQVEDFHRVYRNDLVTKDRSQIMLGKIMGKQKAGRIFNEVIV